MRSAAAALSLMAITILVVGTAHAEDPVDAVTGAVYDANTGALTITFDDKINMFKIGFDNFGIRDDPSTITISSDEYNWEAPGLDSLVFRLSDLHRSALAEMADPVVWVDTGAFTILGEGVQVAPTTTPLNLAGAGPVAEPESDPEPTSQPEPVPELETVPEPEPTSASPIITYGFEESTLAGFPDWYVERIATGTEFGFDAWSELNGGFDFAPADGGEPDILVGFVPYSPDHVGLACIDCLDDNPYIEVVLYSYDCNGDPIWYDYEVIRNTVAHEFGHIIGLEHHVDPDHLMWGDGDEYTKDPFHALGYEIPAIWTEWFVGEYETYSEFISYEETVLGMETELAAMDASLTDMEVDLDDMGADLDGMETELSDSADRYASSRDAETVYFASDYRLNQYNEMWERYNAAFDEYDVLFAEYDALFDEYDAFYAEYDALFDDYEIVTGELNCMYTTPEDQPEDLIIPPFNLIIFPEPIPTFIEPIPFLPEPVFIEPPAFDFDIPPIEIPPIDLCDYGPFEGCPET